MINKYFVLVNYEKEELINQSHNFYHVDEEASIFIEEDEDWYKEN